MAGETAGGIRGARTLSTILYLISAVLIVVVIVLFFRGRDQHTDVQPTPASISGQYGLINVENALSGQGLKVSAGRIGVTSDALTPPGQLLDVNGNAVYVFVYNSPDDRATDSDGVDASSLGLATLTGTPVPADQLTLFSQSNLIAVLVGGDAPLAAKIDAGMKSLP